MPHSRDYEGIALIAPYTLPYTKTSEHGAMWFIGRTLNAILASAGLKKSDIDGLSIASFSLYPDTAASVAEHLGMQLGWLEQLPFGGASGVMSLRRAARAVQCGDAEIVACIGADTNSTDSFRSLVSGFSRFSSAESYPYGSAGPNAAFALITSHYMAKYDVTREDFGKLCIDQRKNATTTPTALFRKPLCIEEYLSARPIAKPLHLFDCVMPCAGGEGFLVTTVERARSLGVPSALILASAESHNAYSTDPIMYRSGWSVYADALYEQAGIGPKDIDVLQTYDDYPVISCIQMEELGFCQAGKAAELISTFNRPYESGGMSHNTSGGQLSCGQAGAAGGFLGLTEAIRQITRRDLGASLVNARHAMVSGYGMVNYDRGICTAATVIGG